MILNSRKFISNNPNLNQLQSNSTSFPQKNSSSKYLYIFPLICFGLGSWQMYRLEWKRNLIQKMHSGLHKDPVYVSDISPLLSTIDTLQHQRIRTSGRFLHDFEMLVGPRNKGGAGRPGYYLYTPLMLDSGYFFIPPSPQCNNIRNIIIVNRGWVPKQYADIDKRRQMHQHAVPDGKVQVHGMLRDPSLYQPSSKFLVSDCEVSMDYEQSSFSHFLWVDLSKMTERIQTQINTIYQMMSKNDQKYMGKPNPYILQSYFLEEVIDPDSNDMFTDEMRAWQKDIEDIESANSSLPSILANVKAVQMDPRSFNGRPIIGPPSIHIVNKHLEYVVTWFSLAGLLLVTIFLGNRRAVKLGRRISPKN